MKKIIIILAAIFMTISMNSCVTDDNKPHSLKTDGFKMKLLVPSPVTRATTIPASPLESEVWSLYLLFFEYNTGGNGLFVNYYDASPTDGNPLDINEILNIDFTKESGLSKSENYHILVMANIAPYLEEELDEWLNDLNGKTENEVMNTTRLFVKGPENEWNETDNSAAMSQEHLPMSAQVVKNRQEELLEVQLVRIVSRFDVFNHDNDYQLISASIWNAYPETYIWDNSINAYAADRLKRYYGLHGEDNKIECGLYGFNNYVPLPLQNDEVSTCIIVGLDKGDGDGTRYYRANINSPGVFQQLKRNCAYRLNINRVLGKGAATEKDAYTGQELLLDIDINGWSIPDQGNIIVDGENILVLPTSIMQFSAQAETRNYNVFCYGEGYLELSQTELPVGFTAGLTINPGSNIHTLTVSVTESDDLKTGFIELKFGKLKGVITIRQSGHNQDLLTLSKDIIPSFPSHQPTTMEGEVEVTSSGRWTAEIYNGKFVFDGNGSEVIEGEDGDKFVIRSNGPSTQTTTWYSFVLVTLNSNTEVQRVLVLMQDGTGEIQITPDWQLLRFTANGQPEDNNNQFSVNTAGAPWDFNLSGANASKFELKPDYQNNTFMVTAKRNIEPQNYEARARIRMTHNPTVYKEIQLYQYAHSISYLPTTFALIPYTGGLSESIKITSSDPWEATVISGADYVTFEGINQPTITGNSGETFRVRFGNNSTSPTKRTATIQVKVAETLVQQDIRIEQAKGSAKTKLLLYTAKNGYGSLHNPYWINGFYNSMNAAAKFGPSSTSKVYMPGWEYTMQEVPGGSSMNTNADIVCWNQDTPHRGKIIRDWLMGINPPKTNDIKDRVLLFWGDLEATKKAEYFSADGYRGRTDVNTHKDMVHQINPNLTVANSKILNYLLKDGPFTNGVEIDKSLIGLYAHDSTNGSLTAWPSTMVPLIMCPKSGYSNDLVLGIDPTTHIIFCGNTEIFHDGTGLSHSYTERNFDASTLAGQANQKFMDNLIAWMVNAALYGENFTKQFYED